MLHTYLSLQLSDHYEGSGEGWGSGQVPGCDYPESSSSLRVGNRARGQRVTPPALAPLLFEIIIIIGGRFISFGVVGGVMDVKHANLQGFCSHVCNNTTVTPRT